MIANCDPLILGSCRVALSVLLLVDGGAVVPIQSGVEPTESITTTGSPALMWIGTDDRGVELEIVAAVLSDRYLVIYVMPTALRR